MSKDIEQDATWRFYADSDERWKWQRLSRTGRLIEQSTIGFFSYEECVADAEANGYVFQLSVPGTRSEHLARKT